VAKFTGKKPGHWGGTNGAPYWDGRKIQKDGTQERKNLRGKDEFQTRGEHKRKIKKKKKTQGGKIGSSEIQRGKGRWLAGRHNQRKNTKGTWKGTRQPQTEASKETRE